MSPSPDEPKPDEPSNDEIISRLDEVLDAIDGEELDLIEDPAPPDIDIPDEDEDRRQDFWTSVEDGGGEDLAVPMHDREGEVPDEAWDSIDDTARDDLTLRYAEDQPPPDPWVPVDYGAVPLPEGGIRLTREPGFALPLATPQPLLLPTPRTLPWRSTADLLDPPLPALLCVADPTVTGSRLLVAAWAWADEAAGDCLRFRISDDGPELEVSPSSPHEAALESILKIRGHEVPVRLHLEAVRDQRGVVLGRDVLAGRFVVDPGSEDWSEDEG